MRRISNASLFLAQFAYHTLHKCDKYDTDSFRSILHSSQLRGGGLLLLLGAVLLRDALTRALQLATR